MSEPKTQEELAGLIGSWCRQAEDEEAELARLAARVAELEEGIRWVRANPDSIDGLFDLVEAK